MCQCLDDCCGCCSVCPCGPDGDHGDHNAGSAGDETVQALTDIVTEDKAKASDSCCSGNKGGNPVIAEVIEISDESSAGDRTERDSSRTVTPSTDWAGFSLDYPGITTPVESAESKSCCSKKTESAEQGRSSHSNSAASSKRGSHGHPYDHHGGKSDHAARDKPTLSRATSVGKGPGKGHHGHHPRPIMPRPASNKTQEAVAVVRSSGGVDHSIVVPRTDKNTVASSSQTPSGTATPFDWTSAESSGSNVGPAQPQARSTRPDTPTENADCCTKKAIPNLLDLVALLPFNPWTGQPNEQYAGNATVPPRQPAPLPSPIATSGQIPAALSSPELARAAVFLMMQQQQQQLADYQQQPQAQQQSRLPNSYMPSLPSSHVPAQILPPANLSMPMFADNNFDVQSGMQYGLYSSEAGSATTSAASTMGNGVGNTSIPTSYLDTSSNSLQDGSQLDAVFQRYLQGVADGQAMFGVDPQLDLPGQAGFNGNPFNSSMQQPFEYAPEQQELQQM
jgi:hypothetical protein